MCTHTQVSLSVLCVHGTGKAEVERVKSALALTSSNGDWLLLHNIQVGLKI